MGKEGAVEMDRMGIDFNAEYKAMPKKTWTALCELAERKLGTDDFVSFFTDHEYWLPKFIVDPNEQARIGKELIAMCKGRE
jgi:hypothetical protein